MIPGNEYLIAGIKMTFYYIREDGKKVFTHKQKYGDRVIEVTYVK